MAEDLNDAGFWLPPEFLADDFSSEESCKGDGAEATDDGGCDNPCFPTEFPYAWGYGSDRNSPVDTATGMESSDEEDGIAGLTRHMTRHFLQGDGKGPPSALAADSPNGTSTVGSPSSTLSDIWSWNSSSGESSTGPSLVSSPLSSPLEQHKDDAWDMLYSEAKQVARKGQIEEADQQQPEHGGRGILGPPAPKAIASPPANQSSTQLHVQGDQQPNQQEVIKQQGGGAWGRPKRPKGGVGLAGSRPARPLGLSAAAWLPVQQQGMRAVFLTSATRKESCGTGVFLPRTVGNATDLRKKPACSTVLLPAKVVQALNLDLNEIGAHPRFPSGFVLDRDAMVARSNEALLQKRTLRPQPAPASRPHREARLPPEWTY